MASRSLGFGVESAYGTPVVAVAKEFLEGVESFDFSLEQTFEDILTVTAHSQKPTTLLTSKWNGSFEALGIYQEPLGLLIRSLLMEPDVSGAGPFTHTFPKSTGIPVDGRLGRMLTVETKQSSALASSWAGGKLTELAFSVDASKSVRMTGTMHGTVEGSGLSPVAASFGAYDPMLMKDTSILFDALALDVASLDFSLKWDTDAPFGLGSAIYIKEPVDVGGLIVSGSVSLYFVDLVQYTKFAAQTEIDIVIVITNGTESMTVNMNKAIIRSFSKPIQGQDRLQATVEFVSHFDTTATENAQIVLINDDAVTL